MKILHKKENFLMPLYLACTTEKNEFCKHVNFVNGYMYATNTHILIKQSIDYCNVINKENLNGKSIHCEDFKKIFKANKVIAHENHIECHYFKEDKKEIFKYQTDVRLPDFEKIINEEPSEVSCVQINPKLIEIAAKCIYDDNDSKGLIFTFCKNDKLKIESKYYENQLVMVLTIQQ